MRSLIEIQGYLAQGELDASSGKLLQANYQLSEAILGARALGGPAALRVETKASLLLGKLAFGQRHSALSEKCFTAAVVASRKSQPLLLDLLSEALYELGTYYIAESNYEEAEACLLEAKTTAWEADNKERTFAIMELLKKMEAWKNKST